MRPSELADHLAQAFTSPGFWDPPRAAVRSRLIAHLRELAADILRDYARTSPHAARLAQLGASREQLEEALCWEVLRDVAARPAARQAASLLQACNDVEAAGFTEPLRIRLLLRLRGLEDDALSAADAVYRREQRRRGSGGAAKRDERDERDALIYKRHVALKKAGHEAPTSAVAVEFDISTRTVTNAIRRQLAKAL